MKPTKMTLILFLILATTAVAETDLPARQARMETVGAYLADIAPSGWTMLGPVELYTVENIYDKINGRSELHMSYGVIGLAWASYENESDPEQYVDVYLYDMATTQGAFGVYGVERAQEPKPLDLGREGYRSDSDVSFWKGRYYANIVAWDDAPAVQEAQETVARNLAAKLEDTGEPLWGVGLLPEEGRNEQSIQYFQVDALSLGFLTDTYTAIYKVGEKEVKAFLSRQADETAAKAAMADFVEYLAKYGENVQVTMTGDALYAQADMGGGYQEGAFRIGNYLAGVTGVEGADLAQAAAEKLLAGLKGKLP